MLLTVVFSCQAWWSAWKAWVGNLEYGRPVVVASLKLHLENEDHFAHGKSIKDQPDDIVHQQIMALDKPAPFASLIF